MSLFRKQRLPLDLVAIYPGGQLPTTADQHRCVAMRQLARAENYPAVARDYLAAAQVHLLAALVTQHEDAAAERRRVVDRSIQNLLTGMHDLLNPPRSVHVRIFHNLRVPDLLGTYTDSDPLVEVFAYVQNDVTPAPTTT